MVAYDISDDKRRSKVAEILLGFGARIQGSVYELWVDERRLERMWAMIGQVVDGTDLVRCYLICNSCQRRTRSYGMDAPEDAEVFVI